jgi:hypothetical protein
VTATRDRALLLLAAVVLFILAALGALDVITWNHYTALAWIGAACLSAAFLLP